MRPALLRAFAWGCSAHLLLGEHPVSQRATGESAHRLKVTLALRTLSEYGKIDGCTQLGSLYAPLAEELDEWGHRATLAGPRDVPSLSAEGRRRAAGGQETRKPPRLKRPPRVHYGFTPTEGSPTADASPIVAQGAHCVHGQKPEIPHVARMLCAPSPPPQSRRDAK